MQNPEFKKRICLSVSNLTQDTSSWILQLDWIEFRLDFIGRANLFPLIQAHSGKNFIATCRKCQFSDEERLQLLQNAIKSGCNHVDLDIQTDSEIYQQMGAFQAENPFAIIASYHNFEETPSKQTLQEILEEMKLFKPRYKKVATLVISENDLHILKSLYPQENLIAFGMGDYGLSSRVDCLRWGSPLTYVYPDDSQPTAPGQLSFNQFLTHPSHGI